MPTLTQEFDTAPVENDEENADPTTNPLATTEDDDDAEPATADAATEAKRASVTVDDAIFHEPFRSDIAPPVRTRVEEYKPAPGYDEGMLIRWTAFRDSGMTWDAWWTQYKNDPSIWLSALVPSADNALALVRRAANHIDGCSYRFKQDPATPKEGEAPVNEYRIWFTAAPIRKRKSDEPAAAPTETEETTTDE